MEPVHCFSISFISELSRLVCDPILKVHSRVITENASADDVSDIILKSKPLGLCIVLSACNDICLHSGLCKLISLYIRYVFDHVVTCI